MKQPRRVLATAAIADYLMVPHPRYLFDIGDLPPERAAPLACSGVTTYGALKKVGPTLDDRADRDHRRRRAWPDVHCHAQGDGRPERRSSSTSIRPSARRRSRPAPTSVIDGGAPDAAQQIVAATNGGAWAVIDLVGSSGTARLGIDSLIKGGKFIIVGLYGGDITLSLPPFPMRAITMQGSYVGSLPEMRGTDRAGAAHRPAAGAGRDAAAR